jgi:hypothetical protein
MNMNEEETIALESRIIQFEKFMSRPYGGFELEIAIMFISFSCAVPLLFDPMVITSSQTLLVFWGIVPGQIIAIPWLMSSFFTLLGLVLFYIGNPIAEPLRFVGSIINCFIWSWVFWFTYITRGSFLLYSVSFWLATACIRTAVGSWHRIWPVDG